MQFGWVLSFSVGLPEMSHPRCSDQHVATPKRTTWQIGALPMAPDPVLQYPHELATVLTQLADAIRKCYSIVVRLAGYHSLLPCFLTDTQKL